MSNTINNAVETTTVNTVAANNGNATRSRLRPSPTR